MKKSQEIFCPISHTFDILGGKWKFTIISLLLEGTKRYKELELLNPQISPRMLVKVLKDLEKQKIISRKVFAEVPPKVEYSITAFGQTLKPLMAEVRKWGLEHKNIAKL